MGNFIMGYVTTIMNNPAFFEMRLVVVSNENGWRAYISGDGEKLFEYVGDTPDEVLGSISDQCRKIIES